MCTYATPRLSHGLLLLILAVVLALSWVLPAWAGDPSGAATGTVSDIIAAQSGSPTLDELA
ncbi:hypothetical protein [Thermanaeromonas toyohensis]|uniref:hypothetical protein n=1 Tax=Thermanaeromonas toyohensis TaxID=161154 RepID=UPI0009FC7EBA|nr:hypothetical protein [Thermanaeromonas toyohensis]